MSSNPFHPSFTRIHDNLYISTPSSSTKSPPPSQTPTSPPPPTTILFLAWGNAPPQPIKKYTTHYTTIYPSATIILFLTTFSELILHTPHRQTKPLSPAIDAILAAASATGHNPQTRTRTLVHLFSNGGAYKLRELASTYHSLTNGHMLPMDLLILDSAPGLPDYARSIVAFQTQFSARRSSSSSSAAGGALVFYLGTVLVYVYLSFMYVFTRVSGRVPITRQVWEGLNDRDVVGARARRVYLFSKSDALIGWGDVVAHAEDAERKGYRVRRVEFEGSRHVAHVVVDRERYWGAIMEEWEAACCGLDSSS